MYPTGIKNHCWEAVIYGNPSQVAATLCKMPTEVVSELSGCMGYAWIVLFISGLILLYPEPHHSLCNTEGITQNIF